MRRKPISGILLTMLLVSIFVSSWFVAPTSSWVYPDCTSDMTFEKWGPRLDRIVFQMYADEISEFIALENNGIDIIDWPLTRPFLDQWSVPPYSDYLKTVNYGAEHGFYILDINNNNNPTLPDGAPNPAYNTIYGNPCSVRSFRQAIAHCVNKPFITAVIYGGLGVIMETPVPNHMWPWINPFVPTFPFAPAMAAGLLDADGFPIGASGWRYWDGNSNGVEEPGEQVTLTFYGRSDLRWTSDTAVSIYQELRDPPVQINVNLILWPKLPCEMRVLEEKNFHLYTGYWFNIGPEPYYLYDLYHSQHYWHRGWCPNYDCINDSVLDSELEELKFAVDIGAAFQPCMDFQMRFASECFAVPICSVNGYKTIRKQYLGTPGVPDGEDLYEGEYWQGIVNQLGFGINSWWTSLNARTGCHQKGDCQSMTLRYGLKTMALRWLNPIYAMNYWEWEILDKIYDRLARRNPNDASQWMPQLAKNWELGTWIDPVTHEYKSKVTITLRPDCYWHDGVQVSLADIMFTLKESVDMLSAQGLPLPFWYPKVKHVLDFKQLDPYNIEVLFDILSVWTLSQIFEVPIIPKHIWKPIIEASTEANPVVYAMYPDPNLVGSGPWRLQAYNETFNVVLVANKPSLTITTNLQGATPTHNPYGYWEYNPVHVNVHADNYRARFTPGSTVNFTVTIDNEMLEHFVLGNMGPVNLIDPYGSAWHMDWSPDPTGISCEFTLTSWIDQNLDGILSSSDIIDLTPTTPQGPVLWFYIESLVETSPGIWQMTIQHVLMVDKFVYVDDAILPGYPLDLLLAPHVPHLELIQKTLQCGKHSVRVAVHIKGPNYILCPNNEYILNPWISRWVNVTQYVWMTTKEDIDGSYFIDPQLRAPDFWVNYEDVTTVSNAYGSYPGHPKWSPVADITGDYKVDVRDYALIVQLFGWTCGTTPPTHNVAVTNVTVSKTVLCQGYSAYVDVTVQNKGTSPETFLVKVNFNQTIVTTRTVSLNPQTSTSFRWLIFPHTLLFEKLWTVSTSALLSIDLSHDGRYVAFLSSNTIGIIDSGTIITTSPLSGASQAAYWLDATQDLNYIAITDEPCPPGPGSTQSGAELYDFDGSSLLRKWGTPLVNKYETAEVRVSEDKKYVAAPGGTKMNLINASNGAILWSYDALAEQFACDGDNNLNYIIGGTQTDPSEYFVLKNLGNSHQLLAVGFMNGSINDLDSTPDGSYFAFGSDAGEYILLRRTGDTIETVFSGKVPYRNPIESIEIGSNTLLIGGLGFINLYDFGGNLILSRSFPMRLPPLMPPVATATVADYDNGLYVVGNDIGDVVFIKEAVLPEYGELSLGAQPVKDVRIEDRYIAIGQGNNIYLFEYDPMGQNLTKGKYTVSAYAPPVPGETSTADNTYIDGQVIVSMVGDISGPEGVPDGIIDIDDIVPIALACFSSKGPDGYYWHSPPNVPCYGNCPHSPNCDLSNDGIIDLDDVIIPAIHYGESDP